MSKALIVQGASFSQNALRRITLGQLPATDIEFSQSTVDIDSLNVPVELQYTVTPENTTDTIEFLSSDESVCTVDSSGNVTAVGCGECAITVSAGSVSDECTVTVAVVLSGYGKFRQTRIQAGNTTGRLTTVDVRLQTASGMAENMGMCVGAETTTALICAASLEKSDSGTYRIMTPEEIEASSDNDKKRIYSVIGYPLPIALPTGCTKIRCVAKNALYGAYPLFFKRSVRASNNSGSSGYSQAYRDLSATYDGYTFEYAETKEFNVPEDFDGVTVTWRANIDGGADAFRYMSDDDLALFKIICL